jgi:hypothetical protein|tara:strand:- start:95 stop:352 length:258 start_codon:yes stop_codon:yes gene_type:complete
MKNKKHKTLIDNNGEFEWEYYFIGGKQKKRKVRPLEDYDFIEKNADDLFLAEHGFYEILHKREETKIEDQMNNAEYDLFPKDSKN